MNIKTFLSQQIESTNIAGNGTVSKPDNVSSGDQKLFEKIGLVAVGGVAVATSPVSFTKGALVLGSVAFAYSVMNADFDRDGKNLGDVVMGRDSAIGDIFSRPMFSWLGRDDALPRPGGFDEDNDSTWPDHLPEDADASHFPPYQNDSGNGQGQNDSDQGGDEPTQS